MHELICSKPENSVTEMCHLHMVCHSIESKMVQLCDHKLKSVSNKVWCCLLLAAIDSCSEHKRNSFDPNDKVSSCLIRKIKWRNVLSRAEFSTLTSECECIYQKLYGFCTFSFNSFLRALFIFLSFAIFLLSICRHAHCFRALWRLWCLFNHFLYSHFYWPPFNCT